MALSSRISAGIATCSQSNKLHAIFCWSTASRIATKNASLSVTPQPSIVLRQRSVTARDYTSSAVKRSRKSFRVVSPLATGLWAGVVGSLLFYWWSKRRRRKTKLEPASVATGAGQFAGKTVLITGAAGDIGGATAKAFARKGATLVLVDLPNRADVLRERCSDLESIGAEKATLFTADVSVPEQVQNMAQFALDTTGRIDCFFNNAGLQGELRPLHEQSDKGFDQLMRVNIYGVFLGMKYVSKVMMGQNRGGVIINTSSVAGVLGPPNMAAYAASKFAVTGMTKTASKDLARYNIRVCAIAPGLIEGSLWQRQVKGRAECNKRLAGNDTQATDVEIAETERQMIEGTPMKRLGKLSEVASVVTYLCSEDAAYINGGVVTIDGGRIP